MVAFSRFALLIVATLTSAQSFSEPPAARPTGGRPSGIAFPSGEHGGRGGHSRHHGSGFAHPTGSPSGNDETDVQNLDAFPQSGEMPPFPTGGFPSGLPSGIARPTGGRGHHRGGKGHRSGAASPTSGFPAPDGRPSDIPSASLPDFSLAKRQASTTRGTSAHPRKHGKPSDEPTGVVPPQGARPTGARPSGARPSGISRPARPSGTPPAEVEKRQDGEDAESDKPSRTSGTPRLRPSGARPSGAVPPKGARPTGFHSSGPRPTDAPNPKSSGARPSGRPRPSGFVTSAMGRD